MLFVHIIQLSDLAYSQVFKALRFQPVLAETLLPLSHLELLLITILGFNIWLNIFNDLI